MKGWQPDIRPGEDVPTWRARKKRQAAAAVVRGFDDPKAWKFTYCRRCKSGTPLKCFPVRIGGAAAAVLWLCERKCFGSMLAELAGKTPAVLEFDDKEELVKILQRKEK